MKLFAAIVVAVFAAIGSTAQARQPGVSLNGVKLGDCHDIATACGMGLVRPLPWSLEAYHKYLGKPEPWTSPYTALTAQETAAMRELRDALLAKPEVLASDKFKGLQFLIYSASKPFETFDETRNALAEKCRPDAEISMSTDRDNVERYGVLVFACDFEGSQTTRLVTVAMRDSQIVRTYLDYVLPIRAAGKPNTP